MAWKPPLDWPLGLQNLHLAHSNNMPKKRHQRSVSRRQSIEVQGRRRSRPLSLVSIQEDLPLFDSSMAVPQLPPLDFSTPMSFQECHSFVYRRPESHGPEVVNAWNQNVVQRSFTSTKKPPVSRHSCVVQLPLQQNQYSEHLYPYGHTSRKSWSPIVFEQHHHNRRSSIYNVRSNYSYSDTMRHYQPTRQQQHFNPANILPKDQTKEVSLENLLLTLGLCSPYQPLPPHSLPSMTRRSADRYVAGTATRPMPPPPPPPPPPPRPKAVLEVFIPDVHQPPKPPVCMFGPPPMQRSTKFDEYLALRSADGIATAAMVGPQFIAPEILDRLKFLPPSVLKRLCVDPFSSASSRLRFYPPDPFRRLHRINPDSGLLPVDCDIASMGFKFCSAASLVAEPWWVTKRRNKMEQQRLARQQRLQENAQKQTIHGRQSIREKLKKTLLTRFKLKIRGF